jgi:hypothetical protein
LDRGPHWTHCSVAPDLTVGSWLVSGDAPLEHPSIRGSGCSIWGARVVPRLLWAFLPAEVATSKHLPSIDVLCRQLMASRPSCLVEELRRAPLHRPTSSMRWDVGATWSRSSGGAMAFGACRSRPSMITARPRGVRSPQFPRGGVRRVGNTSGGIWSRDLTHCQWFPSSAFIAWLSLCNRLGCIARIEWMPSQFPRAPLGH